jgi:AraC-like DNA-binding protein
MPCIELLDGKAPPAKSGLRAPPACEFAEARVWDALGGGWQCLHGCYCALGVSVEWHEFECSSPLEWSRSFHPGGVEICLNISGHARLALGEHSALIGPMSVAVYAAVGKDLTAWRLPGRRHRFLTVEFSPSFLEKRLGRALSLHPVVASALRPDASLQPPFAPPIPLSGEWRETVELFRNPPVPQAAAGLWYESKALELMAEMFFIGRTERGAASRKEQTSQHRAKRVIEILRENLVEPPTLKELGRMIGCSPYYLSRTFSKETGMTIPIYLRQIRMERAADLLKQGRHNVTEAAMQVGYNSLSHFSQAFCEVMGCCPGLYPLGLSRATGHKLASYMTAYK